ncbi:rhamnan synthesis F family protein [Antarcticimicrobium luteum]|uniref:Glycosyl transferase n=1 Tax=Antarcticimicrobium luteum TaxID=2547397 RepID=A0A4R5VEN3_9RHOB|nr:rhamnan synthesis F family protein [Antarcticimicrobium luteum]TDK50900.1 glycosyl transferase [Antarcticimicrobium luteum]
MIDLDRIWQKYAVVAGVFEDRPDFRFDPERYGDQVPDLAGDPEGLRQHFEDQGRADGRLPTFYAEIHEKTPEIDTVLADLVIDPDLRTAISEGQPDACHLACEIIHLGDPVDAQVSDFSMSQYWEDHIDIGRVKMDPLLHYLLYGAAEGRTTLGDLRERLRHGRGRYSPDRPTCIIAVHEFSRTGAPVVGLDLVREAARSHNVIVLSRRDGPLLEDFLDHACEVLITDQPLKEYGFYSEEIFSKVEFAILNSVECYVFVPLLVARDIPFLAYVHEYVEYTFPAYKSTFTALLTDLLVFSSEHVRDSWAGRLKDIEFDLARDTAVLPQRDFAIGGVGAADKAEARARLSELVGRDLSEARLICGAGHLQWRKGTDIFAMAAQICRSRDPDTVFLWIGDGLNFEDMHFGAWISYHLGQIGADDPAGNLFLLPAGPAYPDVLAASDAMFVSSRLDPLPNVVFDALDRGCRIVQFEGASGFGDPVYRASDHFTAVEYGNPEAAATALLALPRKEATAEKTAPPPRPKLFARLRDALYQRLAQQRYFVRGASEIAVPVIFAAEDDDSPLRIREREKMLRYRRRLIWRDLTEVEEELERSDNWIHRNCRVAPFGTVTAAEVPDFSMHIHAYYTDDLAEDMQSYRAYHLAQRIVVTTDSEKKADEIRTIMGVEGLDPEVVLVPNRGRDILPFMELFHEGGAAGSDEIWCHLHQKKSLSTSDRGDIWRRFLMRILLGDASRISGAIARIGEAGTGLVAPFDPYHVPWNASRALLPKFADRLPGPMPGNPLLFPVGNMFWTRRPVVLAMNEVFGQNYPWPNEPIANDGTEFHLIERLWPAMAAHLGMEAVFVHKLDEQRV